MAVRASRIAVIRARSQVRRPGLTEAVQSGQKAMRKRKARRTFSYRMETESRKRIEVRKRKAASFTL